jgi:hypothetical protein
MEKFCSDDIKELAGAMLKVQAEITPAVKDASNTFARSRYATLNSVITASREALLKHEVWVVQYTVPVENGRLGLVTKLIHGPSGQWQSSLLDMPLAKNDPQGYGSAMTYGRRYSIAALVGIIVEDDDGENASFHPKTAQTYVKPASNGNSNGNGNGNGNGSGNGSHAISNGGEQGPSQAFEANRQDGLPVIDGITYKNIKDDDGSDWFIAVGATYPKKDLLARAGFKWNPQKAVWWRNATPF